MLADSRLETMILPFWGNALCTDCQFDSDCEHHFRYAQLEKLLCQTEDGGSNPSLPAIFSYGEVV